MVRTQPIKNLNQAVNILKQRRKELKISQTELAQYSNLSRSGISQIEQGSKDIRLSTLLKLSKILGLDIALTWDE